MRKSEITKKKLFNIATAMISEKGFEGITMRLLASEAGMTPGAAYYYFESKESFVYEYYKQSHDKHIEELGNFLNEEKSFEKRLHKVVTSKIEGALPYKKMATALYRIAANPLSPLSPFSDESKKLRLKSLKIFEDVVNGSDDKFSADLKDLLPKYLWLYQMGVILYWIYDQSKKSKKTFKLINKTVPLINSLNQAFKSPISIPFRKTVISLLRDFLPNL